MKDPARIDRILTKLGAEWQRQPDLRLFQLLHNLFWWTGGDKFYIEDDEVEWALDTALGATDAPAS